VKGASKFWVASVCDVMHVREAGIGQILAEVVAQMKRLRNQWRLLLNDRGLALNSWRPLLLRLLALFPGTHRQEPGQDVLTLALEDVHIPPRVPTSTCRRLLGFWRGLLIGGGSRPTRRRRSADCWAGFIGRRTDVRVDDRWEG